MPIRLPVGISVSAVRTALMNRPRNRQPRGQKQNQSTARPTTRRSSFTRPTYPDHVPSVQQVIQGASVSIVLKQDQATGREVQGIVQDVLTRGNHPRGIKVRLSDGRVGRVQRMSAPSTASRNLPDALQLRNQTNRLDTADNSVLPPNRSLADFLPEAFADAAATQSLPKSSDAVLTCPVCHDFHGDEAAVSRHVDSHFDHTQTR